MEGKQRDTSNKPASRATLHPGEPHPKHAILTSQHRQTVLYWSHWKARTPSGGCLPKLYQRKLEYWNEGGLRMTAEFVVGLVTCVATVAGTVIAALSYFKDKE